jgi:hypothetical protein
VEVDKLERLVSAAGEFVMDKTGWVTFGAVPAGKAALVENAVSILVAMYVAQSTPEYLETMADFDLIQSFSAGSYSEQRRSPEDAVKAKMLVAWPAANAAIVAAMTPDAYDDYQAWLLGVAAPAFGVTEVDWDNRDDLHYDGSDYETDWGYGRGVW